jgi:DNA-directed RNA polymerase specialized sigma24 family protein
VRTAIRIVLGIGEGDTNAETELVERYGKGLRYLLARRIRDDERAGDLLQETLCIAIEKLRDEALDNPERLAGYLRGIAVRVAMSAGRRRNREPYTMKFETASQLHYAWYTSGCSVYVSISLRSKDYGKSSSIISTRTVAIRSICSC